MRRPLMYICSSFAFGIILGHYLKPVVWLSVYVIFLVAGSLKQKKILILLVVVSLLGSAHISLAFKNLNLPESQDNQLISIRGRVTAQEEKRSTAVLTLKVGFGRSFLVYVKGAGGKDYLGDMVSLKGKLLIPDGRRNPGLFDYSLYLKTKGISAGISAFETNVVQENKVSYFVRLPSRVKQKVVAAQRFFMKESSAALLAGILFGDKTAIEDDVYETFQKNGTAHILAVSGIHVSIIYAYIAGIFRNKRSKAATVFVVLFLLFYCALAEFSPSVVRAVSMIGIHIVAKHIHRRYDFPCAIACSALIMLACNPYNLFNIGFQMSYLAVLSLAFALPHFKGDKNIIASSFIPLISVQTAMAPLTAFHFMYFSFSAFIINIPVIFLAGIAVPLGVVMGIFSILPDFILTSLVLKSGYAFLEKVIDLMIWLNKIVTDAGLSHMNVRAPSLIFLALFYGLFFYLLSESFLILIQQGKKKSAGRICLAILILSLILPAAMVPRIGSADLVFLDVGQGDCLHIRTASDKNIIIDGGGQRDFDVGKRILKPYFLKNGVKKIDLALVTHLHHDHYDGIASLCKELPVLKLGVYEGNFLKLEGLKTDTGLSEENFLFLVAGDSIQIDKDTEIQIIYPKRRSMKDYEYLMGENEDENLNSLVFMVNHKNMKAIITGDLTEWGETQLMALWKNLDADILKIGHHGSRFSTGEAFLEATNPKMAVIQVGNNNYGHPHGEIIEKLEKKSIMIYRNDLHGAVLIKIHKEGFKVRTML